MRKFVELFDLAVPETIFFEQRRVLSRCLDNIFEHVELSRNLGDDD